MKIPTISQFNNWSDADKLFWINYETDGTYQAKETLPGEFPLIAYPDSNMGIIYKVDNAGTLTDATAMTIAEVYDRIKKFTKAFETVTKAAIKN